MTYPAIRKWLKTQFPDDKLAMLRAFVEDHKLTYHSCCCLVGIVTAKHAWRVQNECTFGEDYHLDHARMIPGAIEAENEYYDMGVTQVWLGRSNEAADRQRRKRLLPLILEEQHRRALAQLGEEPIEEPAEPAPAPQPNPDEVFA